MRIRWTYAGREINDYWWLWAKVAYSIHWSGVRIWAFEPNWRAKRLTIRLGKYIISFNHPLVKCYRNTKVIEIRRFWRRVPVKLGKDFEHHPARNACMN